MRLIQYLVEKVTKSEINQILNDENVIIGSEFEFILTELKNVENLAKMSSSLKSLLDKIDDDTDKKKKDKKSAKSLYTEKYIELFDKAKDEWKKIVTEYFKKNFSLPVYVSTDNKTTTEFGGDWLIVPDSSIGPFGVELVSPPMPITEAFKQYEKVFHWIDKHGETINKCGFHTHMSLKNIKNLQASLNIVKLVLFTDEGFIFRYFPERKGSMYAVPLKKKLKEEGNLTDKDLKIKSLLKDFSKSHYDAINLEHISNNRLEFRYLGGKNYHKKWNKIKQIIAQNAYNMKLACDPDFKYKEYVLKLKRFLNKIS